MDMLKKILNVLKDSIGSVTGVTQWDLVAKDINREKLSGYAHHPTDPVPKYKEGQLVRIKFHHHFQRHHNEIGIILEVSKEFTRHSGPILHFYDILVGDEKITLVERYLDEVKEDPWKE
jgi:hypothetical protein